MTRGIVVGKFLPPHNGHHYLIDYALERVDSLTILVCDNSTYAISAKVRQAWLQRIHPKAQVVIIPDINDDNNSKAWAAHTLRFLGYTPDVVFSSESYGNAYGGFMKCRHVMVDHERTHVPISATRVRADMFKEWSFLHKIVRADLALRVVVVGAESTGTTTLAQDLAKRLKVPWVQEYGRTYSESFLNTVHNWNENDFIHIARIQQAAENQIAAASSGLIVCDTNTFATTIWQERYLGSISQAVQEIANQDIVDLYILTSDDIPFVQDGTRDGEHIRHNMHQRFLEQLTKLDVPFIVVSGSKKARVSQSVDAVNKLLKRGVFEQSAAHSSRVARARQANHFQ